MAQISSLAARVDQLIVDGRTCADCGKIFPYPSGLKAHQQRKTPCQAIVETAAGKCVCKYCGRGFAFESSLYKHITQSCKLARTAAPPGPAEPEVAAAKTPTEINQAREIEALKEQLKRLQIGPQLVVAPQTLVVPQVAINGTANNCTINLGPVNLGPVKTVVHNHINIIPNQTVDRTCSTCGKVFPFPSGLAMHLQRKTPCRAEGKFTCKYCGHGFAFESGLRAHIKQACKLARGETSSSL